jgi:hypothetical protein
MARQSPARGPSPEDPLLEWPGRVLRADRRLSASMRMDLVLARARQYLAAVAGHNGEYYRRALLRARRISLGSLGEAGSADVGVAVRARLKAVYPQQYEALSAVALNDLIATAQSATTRYGLSSPSGVMLYALLMLMLGGCFDRDPLHPWAIGALTDTSTNGPDARVATLHARAIERLEFYVTANRARRRGER